MVFDSFAFMVTLVNEVENQAINRKALDRLVESATEHLEQHQLGCKMSMWTCGRCSGMTPLMHLLDWIGRLPVAFLKKHFMYQGLRTLTFAHALKALVASTRKMFLEACD